LKRGKGKKKVTGGCKKGRKRRDSYSKCPKANNARGRGNKEPPVQGKKKGVVSRRSSGAYADLSSNGRIVRLREWGVSLAGKR